MARAPRPDLSVQARGGTSASDATTAIGLWRLLCDDNIDAAIEAGLMRFDPSAVVDADVPRIAEAIAGIVAMQARLKQAWAARERHRARDARLQRRDAERAARRAPPVAAAGVPASLPPAAAAALARAKARAAGK